MRHVHIGTGTQPLKRAAEARGGLGASSRAGGAGCRLVPGWEAARPAALLARRRAPVLEAIQTELAASVLEIAFRRLPRDPLAAARGAPLQAVPHLPRLAPAPGPLLPPVAVPPPSPLCASKRRPSGGSSLLVPPVARAATSRPILEGMEGSAAGN